MKIDFEIIILFAIATIFNLFFPEPYRKYKLTFLRVF